MSQTTCCYICMPTDPETHMKLITSSTILKKCCAVRKKERSTERQTDKERQKDRFATLSWDLLVWYILLGTKSHKRPSGFTMSCPNAASPTASLSPSLSSLPLSYLHLPPCFLPSSVEKDKHILTAEKHYEYCWKVQTGRNLVVSCLCAIDFVDSGQNVLMHVV